MMSKLNLEDLQQSWTIDHLSELKREFIERYKNSFNEEKLLHLSEVYVNLILMKSRYPEIMMKDINELPRPLQMLKRLKEFNCKSGVKRHLNEEDETGRTNSANVHLERPSKQLKSFVNEEQFSSTFLSTSIDPLHSGKKQFIESFPLSLNSEQHDKILLQLKPILQIPVNLTEQQLEQMNFSRSGKQPNSLLSSDVLHYSLGQLTNRYPETLCNDQDSQILPTSEPVYKTPEHSRPFKQMKSYANKEQSNSTFLSAYTDVPSMGQLRNAYSIPFLEEQDTKNLPESKQSFKTPVEYSEKLFEQNNFPTNDIQPSSTFFSSSTDVLPPPVEQSGNKYSIPFLEEHALQNLSKSEKVLKESDNYFEKPFEQFNFKDNVEQSSSTFLSTSTDVLHPSIEKHNNAHAIPFLEEYVAQNVSKSEWNLNDSVEQSETSFKQMNFYVSARSPNTEFSSVSIRTPQSSVEKIQTRNSAPFYNEQNAKISSKTEQILKASKNLFEKSFEQTNHVTKEQACSTISKSTQQHSSVQYKNKSSVLLHKSNTLHNEQMVHYLPKSKQTLERFHDEPLFKIKDVYIEIEKADRILSTLGLSLIQEFAKHVKDCMTRISFSVPIIHHVISKLRLQNNFKFEIYRDPDCPQQAPIYNSKFFLKDCLIARETCSFKKMAKTLVAEAAINILVKLATADKNKIPQICRLTHKMKKPITNPLKLFDTFRKNIRNRSIDEPALITLKSIASLLDMEKEIVFKTASSAIDDYITEYTSKLFLNGILLSDAKDITIQSSKILAAELALIKLANLSEYVIHKGELKKRLGNPKDVHSASSSSSMASYALSKSKKSSFILNKNLFDSSVKDGIVMVQRDRLRINIQKELLYLIQDSASFSQKELFYDVKEINTNKQVYIKAKILFGTMEVGAGVAFTKSEAKTVACAKALISLQKKYYTLRVKDDYLEGFLVTRDQLFNEESYSKNKLKRKYLKVKKVKKSVFILEYPGKDIKDSVEMTDKLPLKKDKVLCSVTKSSNIGSKPCVTEAKPLVTDVKSSTVDIASSSTNSSTEPTKKRYDPKLLVEKVEPVLKKFQESEDYCDILFSDGFSVYEINQIVKVVKKLHLRYKYLNDSPRACVCVTHRPNIMQLLNFLVKNGGSNCKFELIDASKIAL